MKRRIGFYLATLSVLYAISCGNQPKNQDKLENERKDAQEHVNNSVATELQEFINEAAGEGMMEVAMADIAFNRSENMEIDQLAETIRLNHRSAGTELKSIAASNGWTIPKTMMDEHQRKVDNLQNRDAENFDEEYLNVMIASHEDAIAMFGKCAEKGYDPQLVAWINKTITMLHQHLEQCKELSNRLTEGS